MSVVGPSLRSIPAHAGEPSARATLRWGPTVYPRPRGGTTCGTCGQTVGSGLSPPTRGNRSPRTPGRSAEGSIPAHAGEPAYTRAVNTLAWVYPRPRGGTVVAPHLSLTHGGLSPPTRGNLPQVAHGAVADRSIPAHAGEPGLSKYSPPTPRVYPRPRGGTHCVSPRLSRSKGLSPPTRGNPT